MESLGDSEFMDFDCEIERRLVQTKLELLSGRRKRTVDMIKLKTLGSPTFSKPKSQNQPETLAYTHGEFNFSGQTSRQTKTFQPSEIAQYVTSANSLPFSLLNFRSSFHLRCFFKLFLCLSERSLLRRKTCFLLNHDRRSFE